MTDAQQQGSTKVQLHISCVKLKKAKLSMKKINPFVVIYTRGK